ncbi:hypothetical protein L6452_06258 [Arctium lappa]|uniref:Uncharacterized protein n=1 Tax=Arctium lappa TaxID=4217 RepID=A0ACB9EIP1_ARCLA|nr:hypothetical protein L6452_06258 [Arctium lappa]
MVSSKSSKASKTTPLTRESLVFPTCNQVAQLSADVDHPEFNQVSLFLQKTPLQHAFTLSTKMSKMLLGSFWLTCKYDSETHQVSASILSSEEHPDLSFGVEDVRSILLIPEFDVYSPFPTNREHEEVVATLNYVHEGNTKGSGTLLRKNMGVVWNYFFSHLLYCISHKTSRWDQSAAAITRLAHALIFMRYIDFAQVIFDSLVTAISPTRTHNVALPRFISLIINEKLSVQLRADAGLSEPTIAYDVPISQISNQTIFKTIKPTDTPLPSVAIKKKKSSGNVVLALMTMPPKQPSVAAPVISSPSTKRRGSKSPPRSRPKRLRKPLAEPHSPSTDSQKSAEVEIPQVGLRGSAEAHPTSSKSSLKGSVEFSETFIIPSPQFQLRDEDELVSSPDQHFSSPQHNLSPGVTPEVVAHINRNTDDFFDQLFSDTGDDLSPPSHIIASLKSSPSPKHSPPPSPKKNPSPSPKHSPFSSDSSSDGFHPDFPPKRQSPPKQRILPHYPPFPTTDRAVPLTSSSSAPRVPISIPAHFFAEIIDTNRQPELLNSMDITNTSLAYLMQLIKEQNSECLDLNRDIFRYLDVLHHEVDGLHAPLSDALDVVLKEVIKLIDNNTSLTLSVEALKVASDARDQDLVRLRQQVTYQNSVNSQILSALQSINQRLDSMPAAVAQYYVGSVDIDITESAFTPDDMTTLHRIDRRLGCVSAKASLSSLERTEGEKQVKGEQIIPQIIITSTSQGEPSSAAAAPTETETTKVLASAEEKGAEDKGVDHPKVRRKDALIKKVADGGGIHLPPPKITSPDLGLSEEELKAAKLAQMARDKDTELALKLAKEEAEITKSLVDAIKAQRSALEDSTKKNEEIK